MNNLEFLTNIPGISEDLKLALKEAWDEKVNEISKETELKLRKELAEKYEYDKNIIIESIEKFLTDNLSKELKNLENEKSVLFNTNKELAAKLKEEIEVLKEYKEKFKNKMNVERKKMKSARNKILQKANNKINEFINFANSKLEEEIKELNKDLNTNKKENEDLKNKLIESNKKIKMAYEERINKLEEFVLKQLVKELKEFNKDKKLLEKRRLELEVEGINKINETKKMFIEKSSSIIDSIVSKEMFKEISQLKEDIKHAREIDFGRKIFDAFVAEFMSSNLFEGSQVNKLMKKINESKNQIEILQKKLVEERNALKKANKLLENLEREKIIIELTAPLSIKQRKVMVNLLEGVKTPNLKDAFKKYLPGVLNEVKENVHVSKKENLNEEVENKNINHNVIVTGDRPINVLDDDELKIDNSVIELKKLAGL